MYKHHKGFFTPTNPKKYKGDPTNIVYRSDWERRVMKFLDEKPAVMEWSSEEVIVPYISPVDGKYHRYFPDFHARIRQPDGSIKQVLIEVKPKAQTIEPKKKKKITKAYVNEVMTWGVNKAKWKAAQAYCSKKGWDFQIITEDEIFGPSLK